MEIVSIFIGIGAMIALITISKAIASHIKRPASAGFSTPAATGQAQLEIERLAQLVSRGKA